MSVSAENLHGSFALEFSMLAGLNCHSSIVSDSSGQEACLGAFPKPSRRKESYARRGVLGAVEEATTAKSYVEEVVT